ASELLVAGEARCRERPGGDRRPDGAAGLVLMCAVPEPARVGKPLDVREREGDALLGSGDVERAKPGGVDENAAVGQSDQLTRDRGVTPALVAHADRAGFLSLPAQEGVHDR